MMNKLRLKSILSVLFTVLIILTSNGCNKDNKDELPELPPVESLWMDFSDFDNGVPQDKKAVLSYQNFGYSVFTVALFNTAATVNIALPVAAYAEAFNHEAVYLGDNSWQWSYSVTIDQATYSVKLVSDRISNEEYNLKMFVSKSGLDGFEDFKWFEGTVRYDLTSANWTLYESPYITWPVVDISWTMDWEKELHTIKYNCLKPDSDLHGAIIEYGITEDMFFNAYYNITFPSNTISIEWNRTTKAGHVKSPSYFGDENWRCWDENLADAVCE
jgi:hypothetical protein